MVVNAGGAGRGSGGCYMMMSMLTRRSLYTEGKERSQLYDLCNGVVVMVVEL